MKPSPMEIIFYLKESLKTEILPLKKNQIPKHEILLRLEKKVKKCKKCPLYRTRTNVVFGEGNPYTGFLFVGEAPGAEEDRKGRPFVGKAGKLLNEILKKAGLRREGVYIMNTLKCRPPHNRDPEEKELSSCFHYLKSQISMINPRVIVALGKYASYVLSGKKISVLREHGAIHYFKDTPVVITFHPSWALKNKGGDELILQDILKAKVIYERGHI